MGSKSSAKPPLPQADDISQALATAVETPLSIDQPGPPVPVPVSEQPPKPPIVDSKIDVSEWDDDDLSSLSDPESEESKDERKEDEGSATDYINSELDEIDKNYQVDKDASPELEQLATSMHNIQRLMLTIAITSGKQDALEQYLASVKGECTKFYGTLALAIKDAQKPKTKPAL